MQTTVIVASQHHDRREGKLKLFPWIVFIFFPSKFNRFAHFKQHYLAPTFLTFTFYFLQCVFCDGPFNHFPVVCRIALYSCSLSYLKRINCAKTSLICLSTTNLDSKTDSSYSQLLLVFFSYLQKLQLRSNEGFKGFWSFLGSCKYKPGWSRKTGLRAWKTVTNDYRCVNSSLLQQKKLFSSAIFYTKGRLKTTAVLGPGAVSKRGTFLALTTSGSP